MLRVVLNPGHHAWRDRGARGPTGLRESDVVREVTIALCAMGGRGIRYEPKRQGPWGLWTLTRALRKNPPDVLVSLHCDSAEHPPCIHESRVVYWRDDPDRCRAERSGTLAESIRLHAESCFTENARVMTAPYARERRDGSIYQLVPAILKHTATQAAVLVELGFLSDIHVEREMKKSEWIARAAAALKAALRAWTVSNGYAGEEV